MGNKTVSLVLSSGGAGGMAHIGVIGTLEEKGYEIVSKADCSVGAFVGGIYGTVQLPVFKDWICNLGIPPSGRINSVGQRKDVRSHK